MTTERRKALLTLTGTLLAGIIAGILISALWNNYAYRRGNGNNSRSKEGFIAKVLKVSEADSAEAKQMIPIIKQSMVHIDSVQHRTDAEIKTIIDSVQLQLKSILPEPKFNKLTNFLNKNRINQRQRERENARYRKH